MLLRRLPKGSSRRYSAVATAKASNIKFATTQHAAPVVPLHAYPALQRMEELRAQPLVLLPTPLPEDMPQNEAYFPSSKKQQSLAVIAACLRELYDVPRAEEIFNRLRSDSERGLGVLSVDTYNAILLAYAQLQSEDMGTPRTQVAYAQKLWSLWDTLKQGDDGVYLNSTTIAIACLAITRAPFSEVPGPHRTELIEIMFERSLSIAELLASPALVNPTDHEKVKRLLLMAAQELGRHDLVEMLNSGDQLAAGTTAQRTDIDVPEVMPVKVARKTSTGAVIPDTLETEIPYNLLSLRTNLETVQQSPDLLLERRQKDLEQSAYDTTILRLQHEMEKLEKRELGAVTKMKNESLQVWMFQWMKATEAAIEEGIMAQVWKEEGRASQTNPLDAPLSPFLRQLSPDKLAVITILELMRLHGSGGVAEGMKTSRALVGVGRAVEGECRATWGKKQRRGVAVGEGEVERMAVKRARGKEKGKGKGKKKALLEEVVGVAEGVEVEEVAEGVAAQEVKAGANTEFSGAVKEELDQREPSVVVEGEVDVAITEENTAMGESTASDTSSSIAAAVEEQTGPTAEGEANAPVDADASSEAANRVPGTGSMPEWSQIMRVRVGSFLVDRLMESAVVTRQGVDAEGNAYSEDQPAFTHSYEYVRGKKLGIIRLNSVVGERMARDSIRETLHPRHLPMLVPPKPWEDYDKGGYLTLRSTVMRIKDSMEQLSYLKHASAAGHVDLVYECLDALGETPWRINEKVLRVVLEVWNRGDSTAGIPPANLNVQEPEKPADFDTNPRARANYLVNMKGILNDKRNNHGERCHVNYKLEVARAFINDEFYMPHNLDFRGRAYPVPPHLNHIGDDLSRGLLLFAESRPLGERGLRWLKIHLANVFGNDKASFDEREQFIMDHLDDVYDSATKPLDGKQWWLKADDPWQCLATCMELYAAMHSPAPALYLSSLPVHQDGTCNGLQHYAALGGDTTGAQHVNLEQGERPADVYSHVARMVDKVVNADVLSGDEAAKLVQGRITRKVVKQTVMTTVYGVTFIGAREQIEKQLRDLEGFPRESAWNAAAYLAKKVLDCIGDLFNGASQIQHWLSISARLIAKSVPGDRMSALESGTVKDVARERMTSVIWTTALGLPIVQPYRKAKKKQVMTSLQSVFISDPNLPTTVDPVKQSAAFPPNFVHSLDATHMMLTALECRSSALTFASVHDSYWTHASTVDEMSAIIRDTFIALHSSDILLKLREEFVHRYAGYRVPLVSLTDRELCTILATLASPENTAPPELLSMILALVKRSTSRYAKEDATKKAVEAAEAKLSKQQREFGENSVRKAVEIQRLEDAETAVADEPTMEDADVEAEVEEAETKPKKRKTAARPKGQVAAGSLPVDLQYILLTDILPKLPQKGNFDVTNIKKSQYFFS